MKSKKIIADENIPLVNDLFGDIGDIECIPGRDITKNSLKKAQILLVRSKTKVNKHLVDNTSIQFVGTATIGTDHVDLNFLKSKNISFSNASGCNSNAVIDYVFACLASMYFKHNYDWLNKGFAIIGAGHIGLGLAHRLRKLGITAKIVDPYLQNQSNDIAYPFVSIEEALSEDIICVHSSLNETGTFPSYHLLSQHNLSNLNPKAILINASRGAVIESQALIDAKKQYKSVKLILDVWEQEPNLSKALINSLELATPHIAGYSIAGKVKGIFRIYEQYCKVNNIEQHKKIADYLPALKKISIQSILNESKPASAILKSSYCKTELLSKIIRKAYDIEKDTDALKAIEVDNPLFPSHFDKLRKEYSLRYEFSDIQIQHKKNLNSGLLSLIKNTGFNIC